MDSIIITPPEHYMVSMDISDKLTWGCWGGDCNADILWCLDAFCSYDMNNHTLSTDTAVH